MTRMHATRAGVAGMLWVAMSLLAAAQRQQAPAPTARSVAPIDLTGYWVSVVTTEWRYRMMTPPKGDYEGIPLTPAARKIADAWDPARDTKAGEQCRAYGAPAIMHIPGRLHVTWSDDMTLRMEIDQGMQTRLFQFGAPAAPPAQPTWQGQSLARWERPGRGNPAVKAGSLAVTTTNMKAGYLRKNGVPYSDAARVTEYFDLSPMPGAPQGGQLIVVTTIVDDPRYLTQQFVVSSQFKKEADGSKWDPTPCSATW